MNVAQTSGMRHVGPSKQQVSELAAQCQGAVGAGLGDGSGEQLEGGPVVGLAVIVLGTNKRELGVSQRFGGRSAFTYLCVHLLHNLGGGSVIHVPQTSHHVMCPSLQECPSEANQSFTGIGTRPG